MRKSEDSSANCTVDAVVIRTLLVVRDGKVKGRYSKTQIEESYGNLNTKA